MTTDKLCDLRRKRKEKRRHYCTTCDVDLMRKTPSGQCKACSARAGMLVGRWPAVEAQP